ncbi:MAG: AraC family transcriptional regulator [Verrucomicrobiota bacterium]
MIMWQSTSEGFVQWAGHWAGDRYIAAHRHPHLEFVFLWEGECTIQVGSQVVLTGRSGTLFILPKNIVHDQTNHSFTQTDYLSVNTDRLSFATEPRALHFPINCYIGRWFKDAVQIFLEEAETSKACDALVYAILTKVQEEERSSSVFTTLHPAIAKAKRSIELSFPASLSVQTLAKTSGISVSHLAALFKQELKCGVVEYQNHLKLERAKKLLEDPYLTIREVGFSCGFDDINYFVRCFKKKEGKPPGLWRKERGFSKARAR